MLVYTTKGSYKLKIKDEPMKMKNNMNRNLPSICSIKLKS